MLLSSVNKISCCDFQQVASKKQQIKKVCKKQIAATHLKDRFVEKHVSTMRQRELLPEPRQHIAWHVPDGPSRKETS